MSEIPSDSPPCPACHRADRVAKVSILVNRGMPSNGEVRRAGVPSCGAYQHLALPAPPVRQSAWNVQCACWLTLVFVLFLGGALGLFAAPQMITLGLGLPSGELWTTNTGGAGTPVPPALRWTLALAWLASGICLVVLSMQAIRREQTLHRAQYAVAMVEWLQVQALWQALYYCAADDGVFLPGSQHVIPALRVQEYLLGGQKRL